MPCSDGGVPYPPSEEEILAAKVPPAMLCALVRTMKPAQLDKALEAIDWKEAGITRKEFSKWWGNHQKRDAERRAYEERQAEEIRLRDSALSKLSKAERRALGHK